MQENLNLPLKKAKVWPKVRSQYIDSLATAMEEMTAAIREVALNANETSSQTRKTSEEASLGWNRVQKTIS